MSAMSSNLKQYSDVFSASVITLYLFIVPSYQNFTDSIYDEIIFYTNQSTWPKTPKPTPYMYHDIKIISNKTVHRQRPELVRVFWSLNETLSVLYDPKYAKVEGALALKRIWEDATTPKRVYYRSTRRPRTSTEPYWYWEQPVKKLPGRQNPFILVEGTDRHLKRYLMKRIMKNTGCTRIRTIPKSTHVLRKKFEGAFLLPLKRAFVTLQFYLAALDVKRTLETEAVIMSGYWFNPAVEFLARNYTDATLPPPGSDCYKWPADLEQPDIIFYLNVPRVVMKGGIEEAHRYMRVVDAAKRMDPPAVILNGTFANATMSHVIQIRHIMKDLIGQKYPHIRFTNPNAKPEP